MTEQRIRERRQRMVADAQFRQLENYERENCELKRENRKLRKENEFYKQQIFEQKREHWFEV